MTTTKQLILMEKQYVLRANWSKFYIRIYITYYYFSVCTKDIHTIIFVFITETYVNLQLNNYYKHMSSYTRVCVQLYEYLQLDDF